MIIQLFIKLKADDLVINLKAKLTRHGKIGFLIY